MTWHGRPTVVVSALGIRTAVSSSCLSNLPCIHLWLSAFAVVRDTTRWITDVSVWPSTGYSSVDVRLCIYTLQATKRRSTARAAHTFAAAAADCGTSRASVIANIICLCTDRHQRFTCVEICSWWVTLGHLKSNKMKCLVSWRKATRRIALVYSSVEPVSGKFYPCTN